MRRGMLILAGMTAMTSACDFMLVSDLAVGRRCSDKGECPPGQRCSTDGQCLEPCPVLACQGDQCGCVAHSVGGEGGNFAASCHGDGLCHWICGSGNSCSDYMVCENGQCFAACPDGWCPEGRACTSGTSGDYCLDQGGNPSDGGLGDGGNSDAGNCTWCGSDCVNLEDDSSHCGACFHSCSGSPCELGTCRATPMTDFATNTIRALGRDLENLFVANGAEQTIYRCGMAGCLDPPEVVVQDPTADLATWMASDGSSLYWLTSEGDLWVCDNGTCATPLRLWQFGSSVVSGAAVDDTGLYLATDSALLRCQLGDCTGGPGTIYSGATRQVAARDGTLVFGVPGTGDYSLLSCAGPDCIGPDPVVETTRLPFGLALSEANVYWWAENDTSPGNYSVYTCPLSGCSPDPVAISDIAEEPGALAASALGAFYTSVNFSGLTGWSEALQEGKRFEPALWVTHLVVDDYYVFFVDDGGVLFGMSPWISPVAF